MRLTFNQHLLATKKHLWVMLAFFCLFTATHAQNIPNANFAAAIRAACPTCIDAGNNLLAPAATLTSLDVSNRSINNLTGVSGFTALNFLNCGINQLTSLPTLPNSLRTLWCFGNPSLTTLSNLPSLLVSLDCRGNNIVTLPTLPSSLATLTASNNLIASLPTLPNSLRSMELATNRLTSLPTLPSGLRTLDIRNNNSLFSLPSFLPNTMAQLNLDPSRITCVPNIVSGLVITNNSLVTITLPACAPQVTTDPTAPIGVCGGGITLTARASGANLTITWQRKRVTDANFVNVTVPVVYTANTLASYVTGPLTSEDQGAQFQAVFQSSAGASTFVVLTYPALIILSTGKYIPDVHFANALRRYYPSCIDNCGNLTDAAATISRLNIENLSLVQPITNLSGIEGFVNLEELNISSNTIANFPKLPENLKKLTISNNNLSRLPELPSTLEVLICKNNNLTYLPLLPSSLMHLDCSSNKLTELPADLPEGLMVLDCSNNELIGLPPSLPLSIKTLYCQKNKLVTLPTLPTALNYFNCGNNMLSDLPPTLPTGLWTLVCSRNPTLRCLPILPASVHELYISPENVACLRNMPPSLRVYDAMNEPIAPPLCSPTQCIPFRPTDEEPEAMTAKTRASSQLKAFPNPVDKQLQVAFTATEEGQTTVVVTDVLGRQMSVQIVDTFKGMNQTTVDMSNVPRGVYVLTLRTGKTQVVQRITKN